MTVTYFEVEKILKTLPIGYYVGRDIDVTLDENGEDSYYIPMDDKITISYPTLNNVILKIKEDKNIETTIRTLLYHEVSHALLTPCKMNINNQRNIVEDERIESILKDYYMDVDFKTLVKQINNYHEEQPKNADEAFYHLVRFRVGEKKWLDELHNIITEFSNFNRFTKRYFVSDYEKRIDDFYSRFIDDYNTKESQQTDRNVSNESNESKQQYDSQIGIGSTTNTNLADQFDQNGHYDESLDSEKIKEQFQSVVNNLVNSDIFESINEILSRISTTKHRNASAINSYSGVFDPRSTIRDDYKYFVRQNRLSSVNAFSKIHINLFIDCSGSFCESEHTANELLYALKKFEQQNNNFSFDLITCGIGQTIKAKNDRQLKCTGGNALTDDIFTIYNKMQIPSMTNINIVMFDGDALSAQKWCPDLSCSSKNFKAFNHSNCIIISDQENEKPIMIHCKNAKKIITRNYVNELIENTLSALRVMCR